MQTAVDFVATGVSALPFTRPRVDAAKQSKAADLPPKHANGPNVQSLRRTEGLRMVQMPREVTPRADPSQHGFGVHRDRHGVLHTEQKFFAEAPLRSIPGRKVQACAVEAHGVLI